VRNGEERERMERGESERPQENLRVERKRKEQWACDGSGGPGRMCVCVCSERC